jgi:hypothetical protein
MERWPNSGPHGGAMTLSCKLDDAMLTMTCFRCGHPCTRKGSWFKHVRTFKCAACGYAPQLTYDDKLRIYDKRSTRNT